MILCIPCAFPTDSQSDFMLHFNNFTIHRKKALPMQKAARIIGICLSRVQEEYRLQCIKAFKQHASAKGYRLFIFNAKSDFFLPPTPTDFGEMTVYQLIPYDLLDAMILFPDTIYRDSILNDILENCRSRQIPVLTIDKALEGCINFRFDYANSFEKLCRHVVEVHHARTLFMLAGFAENNGSLRNVGVVKSICKQVQTAAYQCSNHGISATGGFISHGYSFFRNRVSFVN